METAEGRAMSAWYRLVKLLLPSCDNGGSGIGYQSPLKLVGIYEPQNAVIHAELDIRSSFLSISVGAFRCLND